MEDKGVIVSKEGFEKLELSTGKGILEILSLPNDFIDKLKQLKEK